MHDSINKRLLISILSITTMILLAISGLNYYWARQQAESLSKEKAAALADAANARVESYLLQNGQNAYTLAQNEQIHAFVQKVSSQPVNLENDKDYREMMTSFQRIANLNPDIKFIYVAVAKTNRLYGNREFTYPPDYTVSERPWYQAAAQAETLVYTAPYICPLTGRYVVTASAPFYDAQGNLLGVAAVDVLVDKLQAIIENIHIGDTGYAFMLDDKAMPIADSQSLYYKKYIKDMNNNIPAIQQIKAKMLAGEKGITESSYQEPKSFVLYTPVSKTGWSIGIVVPAAEILQPIYRLERFAFISVVLGLILISILISSLTSRITKPINDFTKLMKRVEDGDYTVRAAIESHDEVGRLGNSLNHMLEKQQDLIHQVIEMANKMGIAGHKLAITMGETRTNLPTVTTELSMLLDRSFGEEEKNPGILVNPPSNQAFLEKLIACNHLCRFVQIQAEISQQSIQRIAGLNNSLESQEIIPQAQDEMESLNAKLKELGTVSETLLVDYTDIYNYVNVIGYNLNDVKNTLGTINHQINSIAAIQIDATQRAIDTAEKLFEYSNTLLMLTSSFHIQADSIEKSEGKEDVKKDIC